MRVIFVKAKRKGKQTKQSVKPDDEGKKKGNAETSDRTSLKFYINCCMHTKHAAAATKASRIKQKVQQKQAILKKLNRTRNKAYKK